MNDHHPPLGRSPRQRCRVCSHPEIEAIDQSLMLRDRTQASVAIEVGVDRSTVSRHFHNHLLPRLAGSTLHDLTDVSIVNVVTEFDRLYGIQLQLLHKAIARDDLRLARDIVAEMRKLLQLTPQLMKVLAQETSRNALEGARRKEKVDIEEVRARFLAGLEEYERREAEREKTLDMIDELEKNLPPPHHEPYKVWNPETDEVT